MTIGVERAEKLRCGLVVSMHEPPELALASRGVIGHRGRVVAQSSEKSEGLVGQRLLVGAEAGAARSSLRSSGLPRVWVGKVNVSTRLKFRLPAVLRGRTYTCRGDPGLLTVLKTCMAVVGSLNFVFRLVRGSHRQESEKWCDGEAFVGLRGARDSVGATP